MILKPKRLCRRIEEFEADPMHSARMSESIVRELWPNAEWESTTRAVDTNGQDTVEIEPDESSIRIELRGPGNLIGELERVIRHVVPRGYVVFDFQTSMILKGVAGDQAQYAGWYKSVVGPSDA